MLVYVAHAQTFRELHADDTIVRRVIQGREQLASEARGGGGRSSIFDHAILLAMLYIFARRSVSAGP